MSRKTWDELYADVGFWREKCSLLEAALAKYEADDTRYLARLDQARQWGKRWKKAAKRHRKRSLERRSKNALWCESAYQAERERDEARQRLEHYKGKLGVLKAELLAVSGVRDGWKLRSDRLEAERDRLKAVADAALEVARKYRADVSAGAASTKRGHILCCRLEQAGYTLEPTHGPNTKKDD